MSTHDFIKAIAEWIIEIPINGDIPVWIRILVIHWLVIF